MIHSLAAADAILRKIIAPQISQISIQKLAAVNAILLNAIALQLFQLITAQPVLAHAMLPKQPVI